jgi:signal transduction histidine kinase
MTLKFFTLIVFIFLFPFFAFPQQKRLNLLLLKWEKYSHSHPQKPDTSTVNLLNDIANEYMQTVSDSAFVFAEKSLALSKLLKYNQGSAAAYGNIGKMHYMKCNYDLSLNYAFTSLNISNQSNDKKGMAGAYNTIGLIYIAQKKTKLALKEFLKAASINSSLNNQARLSANYFNVGLSYLEVKSDSALHYFLLSKSISTKIYDEHLIAMANNRLGDYFLQKGQTHKAIVYYSSVLKNKRYQNDWENSFAYTGLANCYYKQGKYNDAVTNSQKGFLLAKKTNTKWDIEQALKVLHKSYIAIGDSGKAYDYLLMEKIYSDSLFNESKEKEINALYLKQKQSENEVLIKKNQIAEEKEATNRMIILIIVLIALFLMIITIMTFRSARRTKRLFQALQKKSDYIITQNQLIEQKNDELNNSNETKDRLFSIIGHDLRSPFAAMLGSLELFKSDLLDEDEKEMMLDKIFEQMTVTSAMIEHLLTWANSQREGLKTEMKELSLTNVIDEVLGVFVGIANEKGIKIIHINKEPIFIKADPDQVRIILRNLITNAIKFTRPNGEILISSLLTDNTVQVSVRDNGVGMSEDKLKQIFQESGKVISTYGTKKEKGIGIGLMLVKKFVELNNATISVFSTKNEGTEFVIEFNQSI